MYMSVGECLFFYLYSGMAAEVKVELVGVCDVRVHGGTCRNVATPAHLREREEHRPSDTSNRTQRVWCTPVLTDIGRPGPVMPSQMTSQIPASVLGWDKSSIEQYKVNSCCANCCHRHCQSRSPYARAAQQSVIWLLHIPLPSDCSVLSNTPVLKLMFMS